MDVILMCKDTSVLNVSTMEVYHPSLLPGMLSKYQSKELFLDWFHKRYSERSNTASRQLRGVLFGQGNRETIDRTTHALSLSDCYWIKTGGENLQFRDISPYYHPFWDGRSAYAGESIPTLYVNGYLTKYWLDKHTLIKDSDKREVLCSEVAKALGIATVTICEHRGGVAVRNFTSDNAMFESAETSGEIDPENFTAGDILRVFGVPGFDMLFLDALIGNGDRHAGNFGFLRDADTGAYLGMAPLFDYDHAYDSRNNRDILIQEIIDLRNGSWGTRLAELVSRADTIPCLDGYMKDRLKSIREG